MESILLNFGRLLLSGSLAGLFGTSFAFAGDPTVLQAQPLNSNYDASALPNAKVAPPITSSAIEPDDSAPPPRRMRDMTFRKAHLSKLVVTWDELDKDMFYLRAKHEPIKALHKTYPKIGLAKLRRLKKVIGDSK